MNTYSCKIDKIIETYLQAVEKALTGVPNAQKEDLLTELRDHITGERLNLDTDSEAKVRQILERLGAPGIVAAAARAEAPPPPAPGRSRISWQAFLLIAIIVFLSVAFLFLYTANTSTIQSR